MGILVIGAAFVDIKGFPTDSYIPTGRNVGQVEYIHGGVARNVVEDIANVELRPTYLGIVDDTPLGTDVLEKLRRHKVNVDYVMTRPGGMGTWLAIFDNRGDVAGSISKRPDLRPLLCMLEEKGDEIFSQVQTAVIVMDEELEILKKVLELADRHGVRKIGMVSNMSIAAERRDLLQQFDCFICNLQEAGLLFLDHYEEKEVDEMCEILSERVMLANIPAMVVTMGAKGSVYADKYGKKGVCAARRVHVKDTTGAGDAFCAGVSIGLTDGKSLAEAAEIGTILAASVVTSSENVCPRFLPGELGLSAGNS